MKNYIACVSGNYIMTGQIRNALVQGESYPCTITFRLKKTTELPEFCFLLYKRAGDAYPFISSLNREDQEDSIDLSFTPSAHFCAVAGLVAIELIACNTQEPQDGNGVVKLTEVATITVANSMHNPLDPAPPEDIFVEYLSKYQEILEQTQEAEANAKQYAEDAEKAKDDAVEALSGLTERVTDLETPVEITDSEIDDIFEEEE